MAEKSTLHVWIRGPLRSQFQRFIAHWKNMPFQLSVLYHVSYPHRPV